MTPFSERGIIMAEFTANEAQAVAPYDNLLFTDTRICGTKCIMHTNGSGLIMLRGITNQCKARFRIHFNGNITAVTTAGTVSIAIANNGEAIGAGTISTTPDAVGEYMNVSAEVLVDVPRGCCSNISIKNISPQAISFVNSNIIVERVA